MVRTTFDEPPDPNDPILVEPFFDPANTPSACSCGAAFMVVAPNPDPDPDNMGDHLRIEGVTMDDIARWSAPWPAVSDAAAMLTENHARRPAHDLLVVYPDVGLRIFGQCWFTRMGIHTGPHKDAP